MGIVFINENVRRPYLKYKRIKKWICYILNDNSFIIGDVTCIFCSDDYLKDINIKFLQHDYYTDVVTFGYSNDNIIDGDIFISVERVKENCLIYNSRLSDEFLRVIIHGILHLMGYNDTNEIERRNMTKKEDDCLALYNYMNDEFSK
ncbi:MAG: rRNA maturation RNase YbeY [Mariniphaga sp.]